MTSKHNRVEALRDLVEFRLPVSDALARLTNLDWGSDEDLVTLTVRDVVRALDRYRVGSVDDAALCDWAEALQGREDVSLDPVDRELLADALFELSTPELFGDMVEVVALVRERLP